MSTMRARLLMKLMGIVVLLAITVISARSCGGTSPRSVLNPANVARNGVAGLCANEQAEAAAAGGGTQVPSTVVSQSELQQAGASVPGGSQALLQALGGSLACPTTTTTGG